MSLFLLEWLLLMQNILLIVEGCLCALVKYTNDFRNFQRKRIDAGTLWTMVIIC
jgi:hypothetical protein